MNKGQISNTLRTLGLLYPLDKIRYRLEKRRNEKQNEKFKRAHPEVSLPPDYLMYESFQINYHKYYHGGNETARWILEQLGKHKNLEGIKILDWGCGPGRVIRHMPKLLDKTSKCYGTDYNEDSINWCKKNIEGVEFNKNPLEAKLPYNNDSFDAIYGISIFTHLSEEMHYDWMKELKRILRVGGVMLLTTQGDNFKTKLSPSERSKYDRGELVVRGNVKEGHRTFSAFHPDNFLKKLFAQEVNVLEKIVVSADGKAHTPQDTWILEK